MIASVGDHPRIELRKVSHATVLIERSGPGHGHRRGAGSGTTVAASHPERFLAFLEEEVKPFIESRYDVAEEGSTLFGSSLGGLFTLYAFLKEPGAFDAYIATSPAIWWGGEMLFELEEALADAVEAGDGAQDIEAKLVLAVGGQEESPQIPMLAQFKMVTNVRAMDDRLTSREYPSLDLTLFVLEGESHTSVVPVALTRGLRAVYRPRRPPQ